MNSTRTNGIADHSLGHDSETISSGRRGGDSRPTLMRPLENLMKENL